LLNTSYTLVTQVHHISGPVCKVVTSMMTCTRCLSICLSTLLSSFDETRYLGRCPLVVCAKIWAKSGYRVA